MLAKRSKPFALFDCVSVGVDRMQCNFEPMRKQLEAWQRSELTDVTAKVVIYEAFVESKLKPPKHLARTVHDLNFDPKYEEFESRTIWSVSNAFTRRSKNQNRFCNAWRVRSWGSSWRLWFSESFRFLGACWRASSYYERNSSSVVILCFRCPFALGIVLMQEIKRGFRKFTGLDVRASESGGTHT